MSQEQSKTVSSVWSNPAFSLSSPSSPPNLPHSITWNELDTFSFTLYGILYIFLTDVVLYPADLLTTRLQVDKFSRQRRVRLGPFAWSIFKQEGLYGLYRGFVPATVGSFPGQFAYYVTYEWFNEKLYRLFKWNSLSSSSSSSFAASSKRDSTIMDGFFSHCLAGLMAEVVSGIAYLPTDIISQRLQIERKINFLHKQYQYRSSLDVIRHIWTTEGIRGFYRGYGPYVMVFGPSSAVWWASYETFKKSLFVSFTHVEHMIQSAFTWNSHLPSSSSSSDEKRSFSLPGKGMLTQFFSGALAGICSCLVTNPLDVARTRLQTLETSDPHERLKIKSGFRSIFFSIYREEGFSGFYKGLRPRIFVKVPGYALTVLGYEWLKESSLIRPSHFSTSE